MGEPISQSGVRSIQKSSNTCLYYTSSSFYFSGFRHAGLNFHTVYGLARSWLFGTPLLPTTSPKLSQLKPSSNTPISQFLQGSSFYGQPLNLKWFVRVAKRRYKNNIITRSEKKKNPQHSPISLYLFLLCNVQSDRHLFCNVSEDEAQHFKWRHRASPPPLHKRPITSWRNRQLNSTSVKQLVQQIRNQKEEELNKFFNQIRKRRFLFLKFWIRLNLFENFIWLLFYVITLTETHFFLFLFCGTDREERQIETIK